MFCMNTKKDSTIPQCGSLPDLSKERIVVGAKQLRKALASGRAQHVFLAENADPAITEPIAAVCMASGIELTWVACMADLGRACGIEVGAAAAATVA
jgi:large subunit ribosomal protein L7A